MVGLQDLTVSCFCFLSFSFNEKKKSRNQQAASDPGLLLFFSSACLGMPRESFELYCSFIIVLSADNRFLW